MGFTRLTMTIACERSFACAPPFSSHRPTLLLPTPYLNHPRQLTGAPPYPHCSRQHCDLYVVRLLPVGRQIQGSPERVSCRFGLSKPCVRCLRCLQTFGVHRVIFTTGEEDTDGGIGCEIKGVQELLESAHLDGHCSRGDEGAVACGAVRSIDVCSACDA